jgi:nicotinate-nucleotide adenylyltransferase
MPESAKGEGGLLAVLGGTFDPIHRAHLALAVAALESGGVAHLRFVPAGRPPHRAAPKASGEHRLAMARLALADLPPAVAARCEVDPAEVEADAPSYTINTLERLRREVGPVRPLALILGADAFAGLPTWHRWTELLESAHLLVTGRPGHVLAEDAWPEALRVAARGRMCVAAPELAAHPAGLIATFSMPSVDISSTRVRALLAAGADEAAKLLPADVVRYIRMHHLYSRADGHS